MLASGYLVFFLCALVGVSLFFVVTLQFRSPVVTKVRRPPWHRAKPTPIKPPVTPSKSKKAKRKEKGSRKRKRKIPETPCKTSVLAGSVSSSTSIPESKTEPVPVTPELPPSLEKPKTSPSPPPKEPSPKQEKRIIQKNETIEAPKIEVPPIVAQPSNSVDNKSDDFSDLDYLDVNPKDLPSLNEIDDRGRSKSDSALCNKHNFKRKPPLVQGFASQYNEKNMREQNKQKREEIHPNQIDVSQTSAYTTDSVINQSPSPPAGRDGQSSTNGSDSAKTTDSLEEEDTGTSQEPAPTLVSNRPSTSIIPPSPPPTNSVKRSHSARSLTTHDRSHFPGRPGNLNHFSKSSSSPTPPLNSNIHQNSHRNNSQQNRRLRRSNKKKRNRPTKSFSTPHLSREYYDPHVHPGGYPPQQPIPVHQSRQVQHFSPVQYAPQNIQMQAFAPPHMIQTFGGRYAEFDQNVLHPLQQIKQDPGHPDLAPQQFHAYLLPLSHEPNQHMQAPFIMATESPFQQVPQVVHQHQPLPQSPVPQPPHVVFQPVQPLPMSPVSSGGLSQVSVPTQHVFYPGQPVMMMEERGPEMSVGLPQR